MKKKGSVLSVAALVIVLSVVLGLMYGRNLPKKRSSGYHHIDLDVIIYDPENKLKLSD
jgi:hypothetical protein